MPLKHEGLQWLWKWPLKWGHIPSYSYGARAVIFSPWLEIPGGLRSASSGMLKLTKRTTLSSWCTSIFWAYAPFWKSDRGLRWIKPQAEIHSPTASWQTVPSVPPSPPFFLMFPAFWYISNIFPPLCMGEKWTLTAGKMKSTKSFRTLSGGNRSARHFPRPGSAAQLVPFAGWDLTDWLV